MNKFIVITSIFEPTEAVRKFATLPDYKLIVVGDKKSPKNWNVQNVDFLSVENQENAGFKLSSIMPYNHYCRKMFGYLQAMKQGAEVIIDTDDDNIPKPNWSFPGFTGSFNFIPENTGQVNIYELFTDQKIWPRGFPLRLITSKTISKESITINESKIGIWQGLADEDPDVDAIYRLTSNAFCDFKNEPPVVLGKQTICPFNSQNTAVRKELFVLLYMPTYVTFRFTDILRGLVAQPIMWLYDLQLGFTHATVVQKRNAHDFMKDFESEIPMYLHAEKVISIVSESISHQYSIEDNLFRAYEALNKNNIVDKKELETVEAWIQDYKNVTNQA